MIAHLFITWFMNILSPLLRWSAQKKDSFQNIIANAPGHWRALMEIYNEISVVFLPANTIFTLQSMDQELILTLFKKHILLGDSCHT